MTIQALRAALGIVAGIAVASLLSAAGLAQAPAFKTATLTVSTSGEGTRGGVRIEAEGKFGARKATLRQLIDAAHWRHAFDKREITGGPEWIDSAYFDIAADAGHDHAFDADGFPRETVMMLRTLLAERFKLKVRTETQSRPAYTLTLAQADGALGPQLRKSDMDIVATMKKVIAGGSAGKPLGVAAYPGRMVGNGVTMASFSTILSGTVGRPVIDRTGLAGVYDYEFEAVEIKPPGPFGPSYRPSETKESIFTMFPKQLGLKLEPMQGSVDVLVIEHAEMPAGLSAK
jgi:bla regulator protein BlaR1